MLTSQRGQRRFAIGLARAFGGAIIFTLPLLMTMEMWQLGFYADRGRLALFLLVMIPLLVGLSRRVGFERTFGLRDDLVDALVALAVGIISSTVILAMLGLLSRDLSSDTIVSSLALQAGPASIGAMLARSMLGSRDREIEPSEGAKEGYAGELFLMTVGALFLALNLAPTEEMVLIGYRLTPWHAAAICALSLLLMHAFVHVLQFRGTPDLPPGTQWWSAFLRFTVPGYTLALAASAYVLWTFGRLQGLSIDELVVSALVLGFPAAIGAAAARLIL